MSTFLQHAAAELYCNALISATGLLHICLFLFSLAMHMMFIWFWTASSFPVSVKIKWFCGKLV